MQRVEQLISLSRKLTQNVRYDSTSGVSQDVFVYYLNCAQDELTKQVINLKTKFLKTLKTVPIVPGQEVYTYPEDCFMQHIDTVQWYSSRAGVYYQNLFKSYVKERVTGSPSYPFAYVLYEDGYHLNPPINNGYLNLSYSKKYPKLQKRNGVVTSVTITSGVISAISIDPASSGIDVSEIQDNDYFCVVDKNGTQVAKNIPYDSYDSDTGAFTLSSFDLDGGTIAVGNYLVIGKNTNNIPLWPDICEGYLLKFMGYMAKYGDSSSWTTEIKSDMSNTFESLSGCFATNSDDISEIPITNLDYIGF